MKSKLLVLSAALMLVLCGCQPKGNDFVPDDNPGGDVTPDVVHVTSVSLNQTSATLNIGDTLTLQATVLPENATNRGVSWSASNGNVSVDDGLVTALQAGTATVTATSLDGSITASCDITVEDPNVKPDGAVDMEYSTADAINSHLDKWCYFNDPEWWSGASATVNAGWSYEGKVVFDYTYNSASSAEAQDWTVQLLKKNTALTNNATYTLSFDLKSNKAGQIKVNGEMKTIVSGNNHIEVTYVENNIPYAAGLSFQIVCSMAFGSAHLELTNVAWAEQLSAPQGVVVNENAGVYTVAFAAVTGATSYKAYYVDSATGNDVDSEVVTNGGQLTKVSSLPDGKYKVYVTALKGEQESARSTTCGVITKGEVPAVVPAGGPKTLMEFGEEHVNNVLALPDDKFVYWNDQEWCGSKVEVEEEDLYTEEGTVHAAYTTDSANDFIPDWASGWQTVPGCDYCFQIFYKNTSLTPGAQYTLAYTLNSQVGGTVKANGQSIALTAGQNVSISVDYTEVANDASFALSFPSTMGSNSFVISNISWTAK